MNARYPIYTVATECQDCYKCVRGCPLKAIKVEDGYASIVPELCVFCGLCVEICPNGAKKVRNDRRDVEKLLDSGARVAVSLAPSFVSEFPDLRPEQVVGGLRRLGFELVSETALGAQQVSARTAEMLGEVPRVLLSSACPAVVEYVRKYRPECAEQIAKLNSPMLAHAKILKAAYGDEISIVFIGPCIAKKREADAHPELVDAALTFDDLREWWQDAGVVPEKLVPLPEDRFMPEAAREGALYPMEGGMLAGIHAGGAQMMSFSGLTTVQRALEGIGDLRPEGSVFLELLACEGGCINGPAARAPGGLAARRYRIPRYARPGCETAIPPAPIGCDYPGMPPERVEHTEAQIREVLRGVGKHSRADELNCGGCGYDSCRAFAEAFLMGRAERRMCSTFMRKLAEKKTHALMQKMPSAVVIVDDQLRILEYNPNFARFFLEAGGEEGDAAKLERPPLDTVVPFYNLFETALRTGEDVLGKEIRFRGSVYSVTVFTVEKHALVGGIFRDVTQPSVEKERIIERARQVIQKNLHTVQQIAYLIGENAAESEIALNSIVESFTPEDLEEDGEPR